MKTTVFALSLAVSHAITVACVVFGCGGDDNAVFNPGDGGSGAGSSGGSGDGGTGGSGNSSGNGGDWGHTDGGSGGGPGRGTGGSGGTDSERYGYVALSQTIIENGTAHHSSFASASFAETIIPGVYECETKSDGPCTINLCTLGGTTTTYAYRDAGKIQITGGIKPISLEFDEAVGTYRNVNAQELLWSDGATLNVSASGAEVSAFSTSVSGVAQAKLTSPAYPGSAQMLEVAAGKPLVLHWTGANTGEITASFTWNTPGKMAAISCVFDASSGSGTIPASSMGAFTAGQTGTGVVIGSDTKIVEVPGWTISVYTSVVASHTNGAPASWQVAFK